MTKVQRKIVSQDTVKQLFDYRDGLLYWKKTTKGAREGNIAGGIHNSNSGPRRRITIGHSMFQATRLVFLWHKGWLPDFVDHIDRNSLNDKIENLRAATSSQNGKNRTSNKGSTSKYLGVCLDSERVGKWRAALQIRKGRIIFLGRYTSETEAAIAYNEAAKIHHGEFANLNIIET